MEIIWPRILNTVNTAAPRDLQGIDSRTYRTCTKIQGCPSLLQSALHNCGLQIQLTWMRTMDTKADWTHEILANIIHGSLENLAGLSQASPLRVHCWPFSVLGNDSDGSKQKEENEWWWWIMKIIKPTEFPSSHTKLDLNPIHWAHAHLNPCCHQ